jgi:putative flippase GtrA
VTMDFTQSVSMLARHSAVRFLVVGVLSLATDAGSLFILHGVLGIWLPVATALAYAAAFVINFGLNRIWAFETSSAMGRQLWRYLALVAVNLCFTVISVQALVWLGVEYLVAKMVIAVGLAVINYVVSRKWIFV